MLSIAIIYMRPNRCNFVANLVSIDLRTSGCFFYPRVAVKQKSAARSHKLLSIAVSSTVLRGIIKVLIRIQNDDMIQYKAYGNINTATATSLFGLQAVFLYILNGKLGQ